ncbi:MAG: serine/threonine protein kinase [Deltaproteobacteria bacterium]|nr:serine/threonine protein kinase [Deltaproteobacteria bacterium]
MFECPRCRVEYEKPPVFCGACGTKVPGTDLMVAPQADPLIGMVVDTRYRIVDLIGRGGMGAVYRVEHVKMGKIMAMKILHGELSQDTDLVRRFKQEAETVSRLTHINSVSVFDFGSHQGMMYLVMEYIDGQDLSQILRVKGPMSFPRVARIIIQVCSALHEAHDKGIVHRDLKPENILVSQRDEQDDFVKVLDYGLAKLRDLSGKTKITVQGSLVGTPYYMAPEHIRGEGVDQRSDVYALGAVMFKLLTGETPFTADTPMGVITKHLTESLESPSKRYPRLKIPKSADAIVLRAMSKKPDDRFKSAEEMRTVLADALEDVSPGSDFHRFSSHGDPSWHMGDVAKKPNSGWEAGALDKTAMQAPDPARVEKNAPKTGRTSALSKSVIIGVREVEIGTKSDFLNYEKNLKRRRVVKIAVGTFLLLAVTAAAIFFIARNTGDSSNPTMETEPNDSPGQADTLVATIALSGHIGGENPEGDIDWYKLPGPGTQRWAVEVEISGVPGLDTALQLVDPSSDEPIATANSAGQGSPERLLPIVVNKPETYVIVQEVRAQGIPPGSFMQMPYKLTYRVYDASVFEIEPNSGTSSATPIRLGTTMNGSLGPDDTTDWYCLPAGQTLKTVQVTGIAGIDLGLTLQLGPEPKVFRINNGGPGKGEGASLPAGPGPTCVAVESKPLGDGGAEAPKQAGTYQILFQ